jgi:hypothetical protein
MATLIYTLPARRSNDVFNGIGTLPALAGSHTAASQELDLVAVTVAISNGCTYLTGSDFLTAADDGVIVWHTEQFARYMKEGIQEGPDMQFFTHPFPVVPGQKVAFPPLYQAEGIYGL